MNRMNPIQQNPSNRTELRQQTHFCRLICDRKAVFKEQRPLSVDFFATEAPTVSHPHNPPHIIRYNAFLMFFNGFDTKSHSSDSTNNAPPMHPPAPSKCTPFAPPKTTIYCGFRLLFGVYIVWIKRRRKWRKPVVSNSLSWETRNMWGIWSRKRPIRRII